jgi:DNA helicase II / ATP-dependent DNA helicase PcrA
MSGPGKELEVANEQGAQKRYSEKVWERYSSRQEGPQDAHLLGRVVLTGGDPELNGGSDFYIGEALATVDGMRVFSWTAPVACTFFRGGRNRHEWYDEVVAIRAFRRRNGQIVDFTDQAFQDGATEPYFPSPDFAVRARPPRKFTLPGRKNRPASPVPDQELSATQDGKTPVREEFLKEELAAPRGKSLAPVLATLQPDQYDLITAPATASMIVEGRPGTGKTVIASHRAAYLISEAGAQHEGTVLLVGPTDGYTGHVRDVIGRLTGNSDRIKAISLPQLMLRLLGWTAVPPGPSAQDPKDADSELGRLARQAVHQLAQAKGTGTSAREAYEYLRQNGAADRPLTADHDWIEYLSGLPPYSKALSRRAQMPLLACISGQYPADLGAVGHVIVDEAQDVTPIEWFLLRAVNRGKTWTLLGDLHQRRSDHTPSSWSQVWEVLGIDGMDAPTTRLLRSYRSTRPILEYANRLLPRGDREVLAIQADGPEPLVCQVTAARLREEITSQVDRLLAAYPAGTLAVISVDPVGVKKSLRTAGWTGVGGGSPMWERAGRSITTLHPEEARGLEFDAVVVVEPVDFPKNFSRHGSLYTALTRANRELTLIHARKIPDKLLPE